MQNALIPKEIELSFGNTITKTEFKDKNDILNSESLQNESGYIKLADGTYLVSMFCPMPNITKEMIEWWFWWHPQEADRYRLWYPTKHFDIKYDKKNKEYFSKKSYEGFEPNTQYPNEKIGNSKRTIRIDFVCDKDFGFIQNDNLIVCGHVATYNIFHTEMAHIFIEKTDGLFLVSRFWMGQLIKNPIIKMLTINKSLAHDMAIHCAVEYRNLALKLPSLFSEFSKS